MGMLPGLGRLPVTAGAAFSHHAACGCTCHVKFNYDTQIDLALAKFLFKGFLQAVDVR